MVLKLEELAENTKAEIHGDTGIEITGIATLDTAKKGDLSFVVNNKWLPLLEHCKASVVVLKPNQKDKFTGTVLLHDSPYYVYAKASQAFSPYPSPQRTVHPSAQLHETVTLGKNVSIAANVVIEEEVSIADNCIIAAGSVIGAGTNIGSDTHIRTRVTIHAYTELGKRCIIHSGVVIGDDGFGFAPYHNVWERIVQMGNVCIGDDVEIGANSTIDRAAINSTVIGNGVKIDNLVQIGHNVKIGDHSIIVACCAIGGSTLIGENCKIGGAVGMAGHLEIADGVQITGMSLVTRSLLKPGMSYSSGTGMTETRLWRRNIVRFKQLNEMANTLKKVQRKLKDLTDI